MNCCIANEILQRCFDGTPVESPEWLAHLKQCTDCRALASAGRRLQDGLHLMAAPLPPPDLAERIVARVRLDRRRARRRGRQRFVVAIALAAGLLLALTLRLDWRSPPNGSAVAPHDSVAKKAPGGTEKAAPTLRESAAELGGTFAELSNETAEETVGQTGRWVSNVFRPSLPSIDLTAMEPPTRPFREAGEGLSDGFEPVTTSARRALDLFLRELPMETRTN